MRSRFRADGGRAPPAASAALGAAFAAVLLAACGAPDAGAVRVTIPQGASFRAAADSLARSGIIRAPLLFRVYAKLSGRDDELKAGTYELRPGESWPELVRRLTSGEGITHTVTIPEGWGLRRIVPLLARTLVVPQDSVEVAVRDSALRRALDVPTPTLEGYLFPDTYTFAEGTAPREAVATMTRRFEQIWRPDWDARLRELALSRHEVVTLASLIEREARVAEERPVISAVYHNRLRAGMLLQADPTVQYALGRDTYERLYYKDLQVESPYNTYKYRGLPPGPIASPGAESLEAALYPANVPYRFFVAFPDGHHEFHVDFAGHTRARQEVRRAQARAEQEARRRRE